MKQVIQNFKTGELNVESVPMPSLSKGVVLVENKYSLISVGTEKETVSVGKASLLGKAQKRPDLVEQVFQNIKKEGLRSTIRKVKNKLDSPKALGYSCAGVVQASMDTNNEFKKGDRVACAGQDYASHAEIVAVPQNLVVKIPDNVTYKEAAYTTLGAIAMQGVRQANPKIGENIAVIGLGVLGQLSAQILKANGCNVLGIDLDPGLTKIAKDCGIDQTNTRQDQDLLVSALNFTNNFGFDSIIITAASKNNDPIILATELAGKKAKIVVVGDVKMDIPREPHFYKKELELLIATSYGPGRYDVQYEGKGIDYPYHYVRWTEKRNMEAFLGLVSKKLINLKKITSHVFKIDEAEKAYDLVLNKGEEYTLGILLEYDENEIKFQKKIKINPQKAIANINVGFIGAGSFAQGYLIPNIKSWGASLDTVVNKNGTSATTVARRFGFSSSSTNPADVLENDDINTVFIATRHDTHADLCIKALKSGKKVFVEKPLSINETGLDEIEKIFPDLDEPFLMVGYNRRYSNAAKIAREEFENLNEPIVISIRVNAGFIEKDHWINDPDKGGGRIVGEICHFIDLMQYFADSEPDSVFSSGITDQNLKFANQDNVSIIINFKNGSIGNLVYCSTGDKSLPKERIEIHGGQKAVVVDNFDSVTVYKKNRSVKHKNVDKGHKKEVFAFLDLINSGEPMPQDLKSLIQTSKTTFRILDSLSTGLPQKV